MDLDLYLSENFDEILNNPDQYISSGKKKVFINESNNSIELIKSNNLEYDDLDEKEYNEYNSEYFDNFNEYNYIECANTNTNTDGDEKTKTEIETETDTDANANEDDYTDDIIDELYEKMHNKMNKINEVNDNSVNKVNDNSVNEVNEIDKLFPNIGKVSNNKISENIDEELIENDDGYYYFHLINIFMKYYNNKYDKIEHFFSGINNLENGTTNQMELFFDAITEHKIMCEQMNLSNDESMRQLYTENEPEKISIMFEKWDRQIYMFELDEIKLFSPSLIICLNWIYEKNILTSNWNIYNLRDN